MNGPRRAEPGGAARPRRAGAGLSPALGGQRRRLRRRRRTPAPDRADRRGRRWSASTTACPAARATCLSAPPTSSPRGGAAFTVVDHSARVAFVALLGNEIIAVGRSVTPGRRDRPPGSRSWSATTTRAVVSARSCWSTSRRPPGSGGRRFGARSRREQPDGPGVPQRRLPGQPPVRRRRAPPGVRRRPHGALVEVRDAREQRAEARSVRNDVHPRSWPSSAPRRTREIGHAVLRSLLRGNFAGPVFPVNPEARSSTACGRTRWSPTSRTRSIAIVAVPAAGNAKVMDSCLAEGREGARRAELRRPSVSAEEQAPGGTTAGAAPVRRPGPRPRMRVVGPNGAGGRRTPPAGAPQRPLGTGPARQPVASGSSAQSGALGVVCRRGGRARPRLLDVRLRRQPGGPVAATTCCSTGRPTR